MMPEAPVDRTAVAAAGNLPYPLDIDAVLFDLDGTLVDTAPDLAEALNGLRRDRGLQEMALEALRPYASAGARGLIGAGFDMKPDHPDYPNLRDAFLARYESAICIASALFAEMEQVLAELEARGLPWGIVTNKATRFTMPLMAALGLPYAPRVLVCGDTTPYSKPHPAPLLHAADLLGIAPARCLYVGDSERDVMAGLAAGMQTIVARYGYIAPDEQPHSWQAHGHIERPRELLQWLPPAAGIKPDTRSR
ncbi:MAG TPA: HAD-IA family hydrolase [Casimicrobiaceae bacterium]|nr:HAD-IA family hydrolase [Casimicrobiaceae bacterium]